MLTQEAARRTALTFCQRHVLAGQAQTVGKKGTYGTVEDTRDTTTWPAPKVQAFPTPPDHRRHPARQL